MRLIALVAFFLAVAQADKVPCTGDQKCCNGGGIMFECVDVVVGDDCVAGGFMPGKLDDRLQDDCSEQGVNALPDPRVTHVIDKLPSTVVGAPSEFKAVFKMDTAVPQVVQDFLRHFETNNSPAPQLPASSFALSEDVYCDETKPDACVPGGKVGKAAGKAMSGVYPAPGGKNGCFQFPKPVQQYWVTWFEEVVRKWNEKLENDLVEINPYNAFHFHISKIVTNRILGLIHVHEYDKGECARLNLPEGVTYDHLKTMWKANHPITPAGEVLPKYRNAIWDPKTNIVSILDPDILNAEEVSIAADCFSYTELAKGAENMFTINYISDPHPKADQSKVVMVCPEREIAMPRFPSCHNFCLELLGSTRIGANVDTTGKKCRAKACKTLKAKLNGREYKREMETPEGFCINAAKMMFTEADWATVADHCKEHEAALFCFKGRTGSEACEALKFGAKNTPCVYNTEERMCHLKGHKSIMGLLGIGRARKVGGRRRGLL